MTLRLIQVGTGNQGEAWCRQYLPPNVEDETVEVVAAVDVEETAHENAIEGLGLDEDRCYTDAETAMEAVEADALALVVPPAVRPGLIDLAVEHDLDVLTEKPLAEDFGTALELVETVEDAGLKMGVTMTHRFRRDFTTLRRELRTGDPGFAHYLYSRYAVNARSRGSWHADYLYDDEGYPMLVEGGVHHLDLLVDMAPGEPETVFCSSWNPPGSEFAGDPNAAVQVETTEGATVVYEALNTAAATLNGWGAEHVRADCTEATLVVDDGDLRRLPYDPEAEGCLGSGDLDDGELVPLDEQEKWGNTWLIEQFADWCAGGEPMLTNARGNLHSMLLVGAAIESAETGEAVHVEEFLAEYGSPEF